MSTTVVKFSSEDCGICHRMANYDSKVAEELGLAFIDVKMQDTKTYRKYRDILISQYPDKSQMGWPTYIVCEEPDGAFQVLGEVKGGHMKGEFRKRLQAIMEPAAS
ncbi:MAG: thioredoxin family protein [Cyanobacteria bacterium P01_D01_bin.123]